MSKSNVETAQVPGYRAEVLPVYGCSRQPRCPWCWYFNRIVPRMAANPSIKCLDCKTGKPHLHHDALRDIYSKKKPCVFSGHMGELNDLSYSDKEFHIWKVAHDNPQHIFQLFTHRPMECYTETHADWPDNVWAMGTFTEGLIQFPPELQAGKIVAYCEPVMGPLSVNTLRLDWLVIGFLNHAKYSVTLEQLWAWINPLMEFANCRGIPIFCKNTTDPRWAEMKITPEQNWPEVF